MKLAVEFRFRNWAHLLHARIEFQSLSIAFSTREMCCLPTFPLRSGDTFWHPCTTSGADRWDKNSKVGIRVDTPTCRQTRPTSEPEPHSRDGHIGLFGFPRKPDETDEWDHGKAIWDIDNAISTNQRNSSVCPIWVLQNFPGKSEKTHTRAGKTVLYLSVCFSLDLFFLSLLLYFNGKSEADRDHHNRNAMSELKRRDLLFHCSVCLFWRPALAAECACLSEYKRCLRGNLSEVLCWWLTAKHQGWDCNSIQRARGRQEKKTVWKKKKVYI